MSAFLKVGLPEEIVRSHNPANEFDGCDNEQKYGVDSSKFKTLDIYEKKLDAGKLNGRLEVCVDERTHRVLGWSDVETPIFDL